MAISNFLGNFSLKLSETCFDLKNQIFIKLNDKITKIREESLQTSQHCKQVLGKYFKRIHNKYSSLKTIHIEKLAQKILQNPSIVSFVKEKTLLKDTWYHRFWQTETPLGEVLHELQRSQESPYRQILNKDILSKADIEAKILLGQIIKKESIDEFSELNDIQSNFGQRRLFSTSTNTTNLVKIGDEFQVNTYISGHQIIPTIALLNNGKFVVAWGSYNQDGDNYGVYGQIFNANGTKSGNEFQVNTYTLDAQEHPSVASLGSDKFVITWESLNQDGSHYGVYGQIFNADGTKSGDEFQVNTYTSNLQGSPTIANLSNDKFVIIWNSQYQDGSGYGIYGQIFNANGTKSEDEFQANTYTLNHQGDPAVASLNNNIFVVTWNSYDQDGSSYGIYGQIFNTNGTKNGNEFQINTYTLDSQQISTVASLNNNTFVVTWNSYGQDGSSDGIYGQIFNVDGSKNGNEFQINTYTTNDQKFPTIANLDNNKFVIAWQSKDQDGSNWGIYGQIFNIDGSKSGNEFQVNTYKLNEQIDSSVANLGNDKFVIVWGSDGQDGSGFGIYGQIFKDNTAPTVQVPLTNQTTWYNNLFTYTIPANTFLDANGDALTYTATQINGDPLPEWLNFNSTMRTFSGIPSEEDTGSLSLKVTANDGYGGLVSDDFAIAVTNKTLVKVGDEFQINTYTSDDQLHPTVANLGNDTLVITWDSNGQDGSTRGVYGQIFTTDGTKIGNEFQVNTYTTNSQREPSIANLSNGKFVIIWMSEDQDDSGEEIYGQIFNVDGTKRGNEFHVNTYITGYQLCPSVASLGNGKFIVTWEASSSHDGSGYGIFGQIFEVNGTKNGEEFQINTYTTDNQRFPSVESLDNGKFVVTWTSYDQDGSGYGIYGQIFNENGTKSGDEFQINTYTISHQSHPSIASLSNDTFVITWISDGQDGDNWGIYGQVFNADGSKSGNEFQVNTYTSGDQEYPTVTNLSTSKFVITWHSDGQDGDSYGIYGQIFNADGTKIGNEFQINTYTAGYQVKPSVAGLDKNQFIVTWESENQDGSGYGVYGQIFKDNTAPTVQTSLTNQTITDHNSLFNYTIPIDAFSDTDGDTLTYAATQIDGNPLPPWLNFNPTTRTFSGFPAGESFSVRVTANDGYGGLVSDDFTISIANTAPMVQTPLTNQTVIHNSQFNYAIPENTFFDGEGDGLTFAATQVDGSPLPPWLDFNSTTGIFSGIPLNVGAFPIRVTASDNFGGSISDDFTIFSTNTFPIVQNPISNQTVGHNNLFIYTIPENTFFDGEGDDLTYTAIQIDGSPLPSWLNFNSTNRTFSGTPSSADIGSLSIKVIANDGNGGVVSDDFTISVTNTAPVVQNPIPNQTLGHSSLFVYTIPIDTFSDLNKDTLTYTATQINGDPLPSWLSFNATTRTFSGSPTTDSFSIRVIANDNEGGVAYANFTITVINTAPIVSSPIPDQTIEYGKHFSYTVKNNTFTDSDSDLLQLFAKKCGENELPKWLFFKVATKLFYGDPVEEDKGNYTICVTASDKFQKLAETRFTIDVIDPEEKDSQIIKIAAVAGGVLVLFCTCYCCCKKSKSDDDKKHKQSINLEEIHPVREEKKDNKEIRRPENLEENKYDIDDDDKIPVDLEHMNDRNKRLTPFPVILDDMNDGNKRLPLFPDKV